MSYLPKFNSNYPSNNEEKLIVDLIRSLNETTKNFVKDNFGQDKNITYDSFLVLRDSSIGYCGAMISDLCLLLCDKSQFEPFIEESKKIFDAYIDSIRV